MIKWQWSELEYERELRLSLDLAICQVRNAESRVQIIRALADTIDDDVLRREILARLESIEAREDFDG